MTLVSLGDTPKACGAGLGYLQITLKVAHSYIYSRAFALLPVLMMMRLMILTDMIPPMRVRGFDMAHGKRGHTEGLVRNLSRASYLYNEQHTGEFIGLVDVEVFVESKYGSGSLKT